MSFLLLTTDYFNHATHQILKNWYWYSWVNLNNKETLINRNSCIVCKHTFGLSVYVFNDTTHNIEENTKVIRYDNFLILYSVL